MAMAKSNDHADLVAAFLAKGGKVQALPEDATNGMTGRDWYQAARAPNAAEPEYTEEQRAEQFMERVREGFHTGGREGAMRAYNGED